MIKYAYCNNTDEIWYAVDAIESAMKLDLPTFEQFQVGYDRSKQFGAVTVTIKTYNQKEDVWHATCGVLERPADPYHIVHHCTTEDRHCRAPLGVSTGHICLAH